MGVMRFVVSPPERLTEEAVQQAYLSGTDRVAWQVRASAEGDQLVLRRAVPDSGNLHFPWPVPEHGTLMLVTGTLAELAEPYQLPLELARGTVSQLRTQLFEWQSIGLSVPETVTARVAEATAQLGWAAVAREDRQSSSALAETAIRMALDAARELSGAYVDQALAVRRRTHPKLPALLGGDLGNALLDEYTARQFVASFNAAAAPICWRDIEATEGSFSWSISDTQIEWSRAQGMKVCGGPLVQLDSRAVPDWLYLWENDFENILSCVSHFVQAAVSRYRGKVDLWQCAARLNSGEILSLTEEEKLGLAARTVELTRALDPTAPVVVSFDQPWAEYMGHRATDFPPLHFADALVRAGLDLSGLVLEINLGYHPGGTLPRTPLEFNRQLDFWALLGLPLWVSICVPSAYHDDPTAQRRVKLPPGSWTPQNQQAWIANYIPLVLAKPYVQGVIWNQLSDAQPHEFPHGGLFDHRRHAKPALRTLTAIRQAYLQ